MATLYTLIFQILCCAPYFAIFSALQDFQLTASKKGLKTRDLKIERKNVNFKIVCCAPFSEIFLFLAERSTVRN